MILDKNVSHGFEMGVKKGSKRLGKFISLRMSLLLQRIMRSPNRQRNRLVGQAKTYLYWRRNLKLKGASHFKRSHSRTQRITHHKKGVEREKHNPQETGDYPCGVAQRGQGHRLPCSQRLATNICPIDANQQ